ncbi:hypothetical protein CDS [Bradyrhizobium sp.]|nr:hypothetical protein CDS [Bradyrhizobium sp.]
MRAVHREVSVKFERTLANSPRESSDRLARSGIEGLYSCLFRCRLDQSTMRMTAPSPLAGESITAGRYKLIGVRGISRRIHMHRYARRDTPHPALRATFSHKGRREETLSLGLATQFAADLAAAGM